MLRERVLILLFILVHVRDSSCFIDSLYDTGEEIWNVYSMIDRIKFNTDSAFEELFIGQNGSNERIKEQLGDIYKRLDEVEKSMSFGTTRASFKPLPSYIILFRDLDTVEIFLQSINRYYEEFHRYMTGAISYSDEKFRDFTQKMDVDVGGAIQVLRKTLAEDEKFSVGQKNLVSLIGDYATSQRAEICNGPQIISSILVQLFETVMLAEMKSSLMLSFANIYQYMADTDAWKRMNSISRTQFERQFEIYVYLFRHNLIKSDLLYLRACDPENGIWTKDDSFYELEGTIQATMFRYRWQSCEYFSCNAISSEYAQQCRVKYHNQRSFCPNAPTECAYLQAVQACQLKSGPHKFQYVNSTKLGFLGKNSECPKNNGYIIQDGSGGNSTYRVCACNCYGNRNKISLMIIESNVKKNMAVIGIRFWRIDQIIYIQPKEGKLDNNGRIVRYSERWVSIPKNIAKSNIHPVDKMNRVFFFDDLRLPFGFVLTGVKFNRVQRENVKGFAIEIFGSPFDYRNGKINNDESLRISKKALNDYSGKPLSFTNVSSVHTNLTHIVTPEDIKYVSLERSTLEDDFGQSTLPLFDAVPIKSNPPSPLQGIGIYHKGLEGYAGFISIKVYGINYADYFEQFKSTHLKNGKVKFNYF